MLEVTVAEEIANKYYAPVATSTPLTIEVNPAYLSLAVDRDDRL